MSEFKKDEIIVIVNMSRLAIYEKRVNGEFAYYFMGLHHEPNKEWGISKDFKEIAIHFAKLLNRSWDEYFDNNPSTPKNNVTIVNNNVSTSNRGFVDVAIGAVAGFVTCGLLSDD